MLKMAEQNKKALDMRRIEPLWSLSGTQTQIFFLDFVEISNRLTLQIARILFFPLDRQTTDGVITKEHTPTCWLGEPISLGCVAVENTE